MKTKTNETKTTEERMGAPMTMTPEEALRMRGAAAAMVSQLPRGPVHFESDPDQLHVCRMDLEEVAEDRAKVLEQLQAPDADRPALKAQLRELNAERGNLARDLYRIRGEVVELLEALDESLRRHVIDELTSEVARLETGGAKPPKQIRATAHDRERAAEVAERLGLVKRD